jgi:hypothetical protein
VGTRILITLLRLFSSCPGMLRISGKIVSDKTGSPIEGAKIELLDIDQVVNFDSSFHSDENGNFTASSTMRRMIFGLPKYRIKITKNGYQILETIINLKDKNGSNLYKLIAN